MKLINVYSDDEKPLKPIGDKENKIALLLIGRLRYVSNHRLIQLKKELKNFNAVTGEWK